MSILVVEPDDVSRDSLAGAVAPGDPHVADLDAGRTVLTSSQATDVVVVGPHVDLGAALALAEDMRIGRPELGVVLVRSRIDTTTLTEALRAGVREVVSSRDIPALQAAVDRARGIARAVREQTGADLPSAGAGESRGRVLTVFSAKGGAGKTTLSTNLACALAAGGKRQVCLLDLDLSFGDVAITMQLFPTHTLADAVPLADSLDESALRALVTQHSPGVFAFTAPVEPGIAEVVTAPLVSRVVQLLKGMYDFVVIDTPPAFTDQVLAAFDESDVIALVTTLDIPALKNLKLTLETLDLLNYGADRWRVVLNRSDSKVGLAPAEVEKTLGYPIALEVPSSRAVPAAINRGVPIVLDDPGHPVSTAIRGFAAGLTAESRARTGGIPDGQRTDRRRFGMRKKATRAR